MPLMLNYIRSLIASIAVIAVVQPAAIAQSLPVQTPDPNRLLPVIVNVNKEPEDVQKLPASATGVPGTVLNDAGAATVSDVETLAPNTFFSDFSARRLSIAHFRGVGSSPTSPGVTTFIDGVPQLNANSSSIELMDIDQVEFVRGPQSALFGRNTLGGLVNVYSHHPSTQAWTGSVIVPVANYSEWEGRISASGPVMSNLGIGF